MREKHVSFLRNGDNRKCDVISFSHIIILRIGQQCVKAVVEYGVDRDEQGCDIIYD